MSELFNRLLDESFNAPRRPAPRPDEIVDTDKIGPASLGETFGRGVTVGIEGLKTDVEYFKGIFNTLTGDEEAAAANIRKARVRESFIPDYLSGIESFGEFLDNPTFDGFVTQAFKAGGQVLPSAITSIAGAGTAILASGTHNVTVDGDTTLQLNRLTSDGAIATFFKDGSTVGSIGTVAGDIVIGTGVCGLRFHDDTPAIQPRNTNGNANNNATVSYTHLTLPTICSV